MHHGGLPSLPRTASHGTNQERTRSSSTRSRPQRLLAAPWCNSEIWPGLNGVAEASRSGPDDNKSTRGSGMNPTMTYREVADTLEAFVEGRGGQWDWDDYMSATFFADPYLKHVQERMIHLSNEF